MRLLSPLIPLTDFFWWWSWWWSWDSSPNTIVGRSDAGVCLFFVSFAHVTIMATTIMTG